MNDKQGCLGLVWPNLMIFLLVGLGIYSSSDPLTPPDPERCASKQTNKIFSQKESALPPLLSSWLNTWSREAC